LNNITSCRKDRRSPSPQQTTSTSTSIWSWIPRGVSSWAKK